MSLTLVSLAYVRNKRKEARASKYHIYSIWKPRISANESEIEILNQWVQETQRSQYIKENFHHI